MPVDDPFGDDEPLGPPLPPDDRLWRHPSEVSWTAPPPPATTAPASPAGPSRLWALALTSGLTGAVLALGVAAVTVGFGDRVTERVVERVPAAGISSLAGGRGGVPAVARAVAPSVVHLEVPTDDGPRSASGVVLRDDGTILTAAHVVEGADEVTVVLGDGTTVVGRVAGADQLTDVAVVVVDEGGDVDWVPAVLGSAATLDIGEVAVAVGAPTGVTDGPSVTVGVVSGLGRRLAVADGLVLHGLIQTDAPVSPGSAGGALSDADGVVVGLTTSPAGDGLCFAIPAEVARDVAEQLLDGGMRHPWLGIEGADLAVTESSIPGALGRGGVRVVGVDPGGPAAAAGFAVDDIVVAVDGIRTPSMSDLVVVLRGHRPGDVVAIELRRDGDVVVVEVELAERP